MFRKVVKTANRAISQKTLFAPAERNSDSFNSFTWERDSGETGENRSVTNCICYDVWISVKLDARENVERWDDMGRSCKFMLRCEIAGVLYRALCSFFITFRPFLWHAIRCILLKSQSDKLNSFVFSVGSDSSRPETGWHWCFIRESFISSC